MYKRELDGLIAAAKLPRSLLLYGESGFLISHYGQKLAAMEGNSDEWKRLYFDEYDFEYLKKMLGENSLFGDKNIVILKRDKKLPKKELDHLIEAVSRNESSFFILEFYKHPNQLEWQYSSDCKTLSASFKKSLKADSVRFFAPLPAESLGILAARAKELSVNISEHLLSRIMQLHNHDLSLAYKEIEKLALLDKEIEPGDINRLVHGLGGVKTEELIESVLENRAFKDKLWLLLEEGVGEVEILNAATAYVMQLFQFYAYIKTYGRSDSKEIVGYKLPKHIEQRKSAQAIALKQPQYEQLLQQLLEGSLALKIQTHGDKHAILISTLIKMQASIR